jgi:hypothetical protein
MVLRSLKSTLAWPCATVSTATTLRVPSVHYRPLLRSRETDHARTTIHIGAPTWRPSASDRNIRSSLFSLHRIPIRASLCGPMAISPAMRYSRVTSLVIQKRSSFASRTRMNFPRVRRSKIAHCSLAVTRKHGLTAIWSACWWSGGMEVYGWTWTPSSLATSLPCSSTSS